MKFLWGAATSGHQIEGGNKNNDWWHWELLENIEGGAHSGKATDHWHRFKEDLELAAGLGMNSYRFSVEWSRLEPKPGQWDESALDWYEGLIAQCERLGLLPMLTLHHFTLPQWLAEKGGFTWEGTPDRFAGYVERVVARLGSRIPLWCTINEPMVVTVGGYLGAFMPPAKTNPALASLSCHHLLRCHVRAYDIIHRMVKERRGPWKDVPLRVGIAHNMMRFVPLRQWHPVEQMAARVFRRFYNKSWLDAVTGRRQTFGVRGLMPLIEFLYESLCSLSALFSSA
jgi:beta-glucosidase